MTADLFKYREEAARLGLDLDDDDLVYIRDLVKRVRAALEAARPTLGEGIEPPYQFAPPASRRRGRRAVR